MPAINQTIHQIIHRLHATARREQVWNLGHALFTQAWFSAVLLLLLMGAEWILHGSVAARTAMWYGWILTTSILAGGMTSMPLARLLGLVRLPSANEMALRVGAAYSDVRDILANAVQLSMETTADGSLHQAAIDAGCAVAGEKDFSVVINRKPARRMLWWMLLSFGLLGGALHVAPLRASFERLMDHTRSYTPPAPYTLHVRASADTVLRGTAAWFEVTVAGIVPTTVDLWIREEQSDQFVSFPLPIDSAGTYRYEIPASTVSMSAFATGAWYDTGVVSDTHTITVIDRPIIRSLSGTVTPPQYARSATTTATPTPNTISEQQADVTALRGSVVDLTVTTGGTLHRGFLEVTSDADSSVQQLPLTIAGASARGRFIVRQSGSYRVVVENVSGQTNAEPVRYRVTALADASPTIALLEPATDVDVDVSALLPMKVSISDDYGCSALRLYYRLVQSSYAEPDKTFQSLALPITPLSTQLTVDYTWNLGALGMTANDKFEYYLEVTDNDAVSGPKSARTPVRSVRMPSLEEIFAETDDAQKQLQQELRDVVKEAEEVRKEADALQRELQKQQAQQQRQTDWADRKKAQELAQRQQDLQQRMEQAVEKLERMTQTLEKNNAISPETLEKYKELQELMRKVDAPELRRMQEQMKQAMEQAMEQMSPEELQQMMQQFTFDEEKFRQSIERTLNLLKRAQAEQKADELSKRAEQLAEQQESLKEQTRQANPNDRERREQLAKQQKELQEKTEALQNEAKELESLMKELGADMPTDQMEAAQKELQDQQTSDQMQQAQRELNSGNFEQAQSPQQKASDQLQRFAQQMRQMQKQMRRNANREAMRSMQRGMQDMVSMSKQQERLMQSMRQMDPSSAQFRQAAQEQQRLQQSMQSVANSMFQLSQKSTSVSPELAKDLGDALQAMQQSLGQMQDRNASQAAAQQGKAMQAMNSAAPRMGQALGQMMQGEGGGQGGQGGQGQAPGQGQGQGPSPFQRLQQLAQQQSGINQGSQNVGQGGGGGSQMSEQQRAEMGRLAAQQGKALKALEELDQQTRQMPGSKKPLGNLRQIAEDMREVVSDMQSGSITPETRMRQERILSRLLNASTSMNEREYEQTRESNVGQDVDRTSPSALDPSLLRGSALQQRMQELERSYSREYQLLIRRYFELLQQQSATRK